MSTLVTPWCVNLAAASGSKGRVFWKQILPESTINYDGNSIDFNSGYFDDLILSFRSKALDQTPFVIADADNRHTMNPENFRGELIELAKAADLPAEVKAANPNATGLWGKIKFATDADASAVLRNPKLGVSARIRNAITRVDGKQFPRAIVHVLGTLDPRATGMSPWQAVELSETDTVVIDLSGSMFSTEEGDDDMAPKRTTTKGSKADTALANITAEQIDAMSEAELDEWMQANDLDPADFADLVVDTEGGEPEGDDGDDDGTDDDDFEDDDTDAGNSGSGNEGGEPVTKLSNADASAIDLANATAQSANRRAQEALARMAAAEWNEARNVYLAAGVPPYMLDLAEPVLSRPSQMVVDLSNTDDDDLNVTEILTAMLDGARGTIDMSNEVGHGGNGTDSSDEDDALLTAWGEQYGD